jgi:hypothetical protein
LAKYLVLLAWLVTATNAFAEECIKSPVSPAQSISNFKQKLHSQELMSFRVFFVRYNHSPPILMTITSMEKYWEIQSDQRKLLEYAASLETVLEHVQFCKRVPGGSFNWAIVFYGSNGERIFSAYAERRFLNASTVRAKIGDVSVAINASLLRWFEENFLKTGEETPYVHPNVVHHPGCDRSTWRDGYC